MRAQERDVISGEAREVMGEMVWGIPGGRFEGEGLSG